LWYYLKMDKFIILWVTGVLLAATLYIFGATGIFILAGALFVFHFGYRAITGRWFDSE